MNVVSILLTGSLITGGLGAGTYMFANNQSAAGQTVETVNTISEIKAQEIALGQSKGGIVVKREFEEEHGMKKYEITIIKQEEEFEVEINAETGKVIKFEHERLDKDDDGDEIALKGATPAISFEKAKKTALDKMKGSVNKAELDYEDKRLIYEIEIGTADHREAEVIVDAANGNVLSIEVND